MILYLLFGSSLARLDMAGFLARWLPFMLSTMLIRQAAIACWQPDPAAKGVHIRAMLLVFGTWPVYTLALACALLRIKIPFIATPKQRERGIPIAVLIPQILTLVLLVCSVGWRFMHQVDLSDWVIIGFALVNVVMYSGVLYAAWETNRAGRRVQIPAWEIQAA